MALLGMKKKQAFGQMFDPLSNGPFGTPGIGDNQQMGAPVQGMGRLPDVANMPDMTQQQDQQPAKFKPSLLGVIGDAMQAFGDGEPTYMNSVREQQEHSEMMRQKAMQAQQERQTKWQDYVREAEYDRANAAPKDPYRFEANNGDVYQLGPDGKPVRVFADPTPKTTYITAENGDGTKTVIPVVNGVPQMGGGPRYTPAAKGVTFKPIDGGPTPSASGNFRPK